MTSEADRLLAAGTTITVAGREEAVRFSLLALKRCEDRYESLQGTLNELNWLSHQLADGYPEPIADRLAVMLACVIGADGPVDAWSPPDVCVDALVGAWTEAFPLPEGKAGGASETPPSSGAPGGGSPSSTAA